MRTIAVVVGAGALTSVGESARETGFLLRAGAAGMTQATLVDGNDEPVTMCLVPTLDPLLVGPGRALRIARSAMEDALGDLGPVAKSLRVRIAVAVDERLARPSGGVVPAAVLASMLERRASELCAGATAIACACGAAAPPLIIPDLVAALASGGADAVLLGGAHSDYDPEVVAELDGAGRLYAPGRRDALIPGEGAGFVVLMRPEAARRWGLPVRAVVHEAALAYERATPDNDHPRYEAAGMTVAVKKAGAPLVDEKRRAGWILTDMTFELRRIYEWQSVLVRTQDLWCEPQALDAPAQRLGHLGAAAMPLHLALAATAWRHGYAPHPVAMSVAGSDAGERAAILVSCPG